MKDRNNLKKMIYGILIPLTLGLICSCGGGVNEFGVMSWALDGGGLDGGGDAGDAGDGCTSDYDCIDNEDGPVCLIPYGQTTGECVECRNDSTCMDEILDKCHTDRNECVDCITGADCHPNAECKDCSCVAKYPEVV